MRIERAPYNPSTEVSDEVRTIKLIGNYGLCPDSPAPPKPSPGVVADALWEDQVHLPKPQPYVAPGKAIVGKDAFLEIRGDHTITPPALGAFGDTFTITATATHYDIDWGDGTTSTASDAGGPWPDGDIRHGYVHDGTYTITVTEYWHGTYSLNGGPAQAVPGPELHTTETLTLPVEQVQAVGG